MNETRLPFVDYAAGPVLGRVVPSASLWSAGDLIPKPEDIQLGYSRSTSLISLTRTLSPLTLRRSHTWIKLNEPESHLDSIADTVQTSGALPTRFTAIGLTRKDLPLLALLAERGCTVANASELEVDTDDIVSHQETISRPGDRRNDSGQVVDLVVARHILEHTFDMVSFLRSLRKLIHSRGSILFEVPDAGVSIMDLNYSELWEEHIHYFTKASLRSVLTRLGWHIVFLESGISDGERILVCLARSIPQEAMVAPDSRNGWTEGELAAAQDFCTSIGLVRRLAAEQLAAAGGERVVFVGANHCTSTMIDLVCASELDIAIVDDDPRKQDLLTSRRGILVQDLVDVSLKAEDLVLVSINPARSTNVMARISQTRPTRGPMMFTSEWGVTQEKY